MAGRQESNDSQQDSTSTDQQTTQLTTDTTAADQQPTQPNTYTSATAQNIPAVTENEAIIRLQDVQNQQVQQQVTEHLVGAQQIPTRSTQHADCNVITRDATRLPSYADISCSLPPSDTHPNAQCSGSQTDVNPQTHSVDDIGVMLDYTPPGDDSYNGLTPTSGRSSRRRRRHRRSRRSRSRRTGVMSHIRTLTNSSWFGQFLSGFFTGMMFLAIGIVFLVYFHHLPTYIGVLFILVSLPPFCMAVNRLVFSPTDILVKTPKQRYELIYRNSFPD